MTSLARPEIDPSQLEAMPAAELLGWARTRFGGRVALASSFGLEDVVLLDLALKVDRAFPIFALDTGRLPDETYAVAEAWRRRGARIRWYVPDRAAVEALENEHGLYSFRESLEARHACCAVRKVEPLRRALAGLDAWVTGLRREQNVTRAELHAVAPDVANGGLLKLSPLAGWTTEQVWAHVREHRLPYSALHDQGYPSIGCAPCTRAVQPGEHPRAGRWWWESPDHKECGLHPRGVSRG